MMPEDRREVGPDALGVFAGWLVRIEQGDPSDFGDLLRLHPAFAAELEQLHATWRRLSEAGGPLRSVHADVVERFGEEADSKISLHGERTASPGSTSGSARLAALAARSGSFGRYEIEGEIARGGMGAILRAWDEDLRRHLAMKVVLDGSTTPGKTGTAPEEARTIARFLEEAQVTGQLDHPGIVPVHELGIDSEGRLYFTMKLVVGRDLKQILALVFAGEEGWSETRALGVILKACEAVAYAHKKGVIHRDLKPANVMVGSFGEVFVMDWGLARVLGRKDLHDIRLAPEHGARGGGVRSDRREEVEAGSESPIVTLEGDVVGTPAYMPPEQARGEVEKLSTRSDVYSIGAMLYHLLAREMPYVPSGARVSHRAVLARVLGGPPRPVHELNEAVPAELAAICEKAMAREAEDRYPDTLALAEDLRAYLEHRVVGAYETGAVAELRKWVGRNKPLASALAAAVLLLVAGLTASLIFKARADEKAAELSTANTTIQGKNAELTSARNAAEQKANDVLSLSAIQDLKDLEDRADALWPAEPGMLPKYEAWLADARLLIDGQPGDPANGVKKRPSLAEHEAKLAEVRLRAREISPEQAEADRRASPAYAEWQKVRGGLQWMRRMLGQEPWPSEPETESDLAKESLPTDAKSLNARAWTLVDTDPQKIVYGSEVRGLILARRALAVAGAAERPGIRDTLARALYRTGRFEEALAEEQRAVDEAQGVMKNELSDSLDHMRSVVEHWTTESGRSKSVENLAKVSARVADLETVLLERRTYEFEDPTDRWWHAQLSSLVASLKAFEGEKSGGLDSSGISRKHGWGIPKRAEFARGIPERSVEGPEARRRWSEAIAAVASSPKYGGLKLAPQLGLLPIGADPDSGLWEFAHLETGEPAVRGSDGKLVLQESTGLVLVLIPAGNFWMGAQSGDEHAEHYDPQARSNEAPVHEVELSPYFLSKYEMTQGQWERFTGVNPSQDAAPGTFGGHRYTLLYPVEQVSWAQCVDVTSRLSLTLPSEAQWENGCRAGTDTPWWTGADRESLRGKVNLADQAIKRTGATWSEIDDWPDLDDGWAGHAPVGTFPANAFGLHEVHGNVWEWCLDWAGDSFYGRSPRRDPVAPPVTGGTHIYRGGSFGNAAKHARSANRYDAPPDYQHFTVGLRPARALRPSL
jgi:formylglycine-generating enzyme required for sulfatase activity/serine/threonine protein kinase